MRISDWSSDVCSSDLLALVDTALGHLPGLGRAVDPLADEDMALAVEQHHADTGTIGKLAHDPRPFHSCAAGAVGRDRPLYQGRRAPHMRSRDRKSTRLNSSH